MTDPLRPPPELQSESLRAAARQARTGHGEAMARARELAERQTQRVRAAQVRAATRPIGRTP